MRPRHLALALALLIAGSCQRTENLVTFDQGTVVSRLELHDRDNRVLWRVDATSTHTVREVSYGVVPAGYTQVTPTRGVPRPLRAGEPLLVIYGVPTGWVRHWGQAAGSAGYLGGAYLTGPWCGTSAAEVFGEGLRSINEMPDPRTHPCP